MRRQLIVAVIAATSLLGVCSSTPARAQRRRVPREEVQYDEPQIERGRPVPLLDGVGSVIGVFDKLALWDRRTRNHDVGDETEVAVANYMADNGLDHTKVRINQYAPGDEWRRLVDNKEVGAGWRYTFGAITTLGYTLFPGRLLGRDSYNPYTDTVNIYSDLPPLAMEQAGHAKNIRSRNYPGTYATITGLPLINLSPEKIAKDDVVDYVSRTGDYAAQQEAADVLTPQYGGEVGGQIGQFLGAGELVPRLAGAAVGHAVKKRPPTSRSRPRYGAPIAAEPDFEEAEVQQASAEEPIAPPPAPRPRVKPRKRAQ